MPSAKLGKRTKVQLVVKEFAKECKEVIREKIRRALNARCKLTLGVDTWKNKGKKRWHYNLLSCLPETSWEPGVQQPLRGASQTRAGCGLSAERVWRSQRAFVFAGFSTWLVRGSIYARSLSRAASTLVAYPGCVLRSLLALCSLCACGGLAGQSI